MSFHVYILGVGLRAYKQFLLIKESPLPLLMMLEQTRFTDTDPTSFFWLKSLQCCQSRKQHWDRRLRRSGNPRESLGLAFNTDLAFKDTSYQHDNIFKLVQPPGHFYVTVKSDNNITKQHKCIKSPEGTTDVEDSTLSSGSWEGR